MTRTFQEAWIAVIRYLMANSWEWRNLIVQVEQPASFDQGMHESITTFMEDNNLLPPKDVAYTIFPHGLYKDLGSASRLFQQYNRVNGMFDRIQRRSRRWGTYFRRMTNYERGSAPVNQLENIINAINNRGSVHKAAYTIIIQRPGNETILTMGSPCLNYLAIQLAQPGSTVLGILGVYRHHDFLKRAYGNYWGLCNLLNFLAEESNCEAGPLTCVSSRAYVSQEKRALREFIQSF